MRNLLRDFLPIGPVGAATWGIAAAPSATPTSGAAEGTSAGLPEQKGVDQSIGALGRAGCSSSDTLLPLSIRHDHSGERHVVTVGRLPDGMYQWEERPGAPPSNAGHGDVRRIIKVILVTAKDGQPAPTSRGDLVGAAPAPQITQQPVRVLEACWANRTV